MALFTEVVEIVAPAEAVAGSRVDIIVRIKNKHSSTIGILPHGAVWYDGTWLTISFPDGWANVAGGQTHSFAGYFTMPARSGTIHAYSYFYDEDWRFDDEKTKDVKVTELIPAFREFKITDCRAV